MKSLINSRYVWFIEGCQSCKKKKPIKHWNMLVIKSHAIFRGRTSSLIRLPPYLALKRKEYLGTKEILILFHFTKTFFFFKLHVFP